MHRGGNYILIGKTAICVGIIIILALVLPSQFWWFVLGISLICIGIWLRKCFK